MTQYPAVIELSDLDGTNGFRLDGEADSKSGQSVASAGDVNGDGLADLIVGAPVTQVGGSQVGVSYVVFGAATGFAAHIDLSAVGGAQGFQIFGAAVGGEFGRSVAAAGDVNGDGIDDLIVGAQGASASYVVFGAGPGPTADVAVSSLDGSNGFKLSTAGESAGRSVASAGDVNGDGFADLIVGANRADPNGNNNAGAAYVVFGEASGFAADLELSSLDGTNGFKLSGAATDDGAGYSAASVGDVNGDGFDDVIVGAPNADPNGGASGASYVVFGKASGFAANIDLSSLNGTNGFTISGAATYDSSGFSVASAGDVNGDGYLDLIIGATGSDPTGNSSGASYVVFGKASGFAANLELSSLDGGNGFRISGEHSSDFSGISVASAGDVNGDGFDDVIVGAAGAPNGTQIGAAYVVFGKASGFAANLDLSSLDGTNGFKLTGVAAGDLAGYSVASAGDVNGDGLDDLIVGAVYAQTNGSHSGSSYVVFSRLPDAAVNRTGTDASQHLVGGNFNDTLSGLGGGDSLYGNGGADQLAGGKGADVLYGGAGADQLDGGKGADAASYFYAPSAVTVSLALAGAQNTHGAGNDTLVSIETLVGSAFDDQLTGSGGRNTLDGGAGNDVLNGGGGNGTDTLIGGDGIDTASYSGASAGVRVSLAIKPFQNTISAGKDKLTGIENLTGSSFDDKLTGDNHANVLDGGAGKDTLAGGNGADVFVFHALGDSTLAAPDLITDFTAGDHIDLHAIDANSGAGGDQAFHLGATNGHAADIVVTYASGPDRTTVSLYVDGDATADAAIQLSGDHTGLTATDFVL